MTLIECIERSAERLVAAGVSFGHGTTQAFDEAAWLVMWQLGVPLGDLNAHAADTLSSADQRRAQDIVDQRIHTRRPAAYLTGEAWLQGVPFFVNEHVIVPRSLIAEPLVDGTLDAWLAPHARRVLDLCTGNASLAVLAALAWPEVEVDACDISADALAVAAMNVKRHQLGQRITLRQGDGLSGARGRYDLILCNPPYVNRSSMSRLPPEYQAEPALALDGGVDGGSDGMDFIRKLLAGVAQHMNDGAVLVIEVGHERAHFEAAFPDLEVVWLSTSAGDDQLLLIEKHKIP